MTDVGKTDAQINHLLETEQRRCAALIEKDVDALRNLVTSDYVHTHGNGHTDDYDSYFAMVSGPICYTKMNRTGLSVRVYGDAAVMVGDAAIGVKPNADAETISVNFRIQQVWVASDGAWRSCAYQATTLP
jgi:hypothetical protein